MYVDAISSTKSLNPVKQNWINVYDADPEAHFFLSWTWLVGRLNWYDPAIDPWTILAAKPSKNDRDYVAFFPLRLFTDSHDNGQLFNQLYPAGSCEADYTGMLCLPSYETQSVDAFAHYIQAQNFWSTFNLEHILTNDGRMSRLLKYFSERDYSIDRNQLSETDFLDRIDDSVSPAISLPNNWDEYLQSLGSNTRQKLRRFLRKVDHSDDYRISRVSRDTLSRDIEILWTFWLARWASRKDADMCNSIGDFVKTCLTRCFEDNCLLLPILWHHDRPLGALAIFVDRSKKTLLFDMGGRDDSIKTPPPGIVLHAYAIRYAIQQGFKTYDFLVGNEAYKYMFGATERAIRSIHIRPHNWSAPRPLAPSTIHAAYAIASSYHQNHRLEEAERGYRQVIDIAPHHTGSLYGLAVVLQRQHQLPAAVEILQTLLAREPHHLKAWFTLGSLYQMQEQFPNAVNAYQHVLSLDPDTLAVKLGVYYNLGFIHQQQSNWTDAIANYRQALALKPDFLEADVSLAQVHLTQAQLPPDRYSHYAKASNQLGKRRYAANDLDGAIDYFRLAILFDSQHVEAHINLALVLQELGSPHWDEAIAHYHQVLAIDPESTIAQTHIANLRFAKGELAENDCETYARANTALGIEAIGAEQFERAIQYCQHAIDLQPNWIDAHLTMGRAWHAMGRWDEAIACYRTVLRLKPDCLIADVNLANSLFALNQLPPSKQSHYATLNATLGNRSQAEGELRAATAFYQQALAMQPDFDEARHQLRTVLQERSDGNINISCSKTWAT